MSAERGARRLAGCAALAAALALAGACGPSGPRPIAPGTPCAGCGMEIGNLRFAAELEDGGRWKAFDDVSCLLRDARTNPRARAWLTDYDSRTLHRADSLWVVKGSFPTPMGGGYAAFLDRAAAARVAEETGGRLDRFAAFLAAGAAR